MSNITEAQLRRLTKPQLVEAYLKLEERRRFEGASYNAKIKRMAATAASPAGTFAERCAKRREAAIALGAQLGRGATASEVDAYLANA